MFKRGIYKLKRPGVVIVDGEERRKAVRIIAHLLEQGGVRAGTRISLPGLFLNRTFVLDRGSCKKDALSFFMNHSEKNILLINRGERDDEAEQRLRRKDLLLICSEAEDKRTVQENTKAKGLTFGFRKESDLSGSDLKTKKGSTNFKLNYRGNSVPIWLRGEWSRKETLVLLGAILVSLQSGLNLVKISQLLKGFEKERK